MSRTITLIGLGPGDPALLTRAAWDALEAAPVIATPTPAHPALAHLPPDKLRPLPDGDTDAAIGSYALPGTPHEHPLSTHLREQAALHGWYIRVIPGVSLIDACCEALAVARHATGFQVIDAATLLDPPPLVEAASSPAWCEIQQIRAYVPPLLPYPLLPTRPALIMLHPEPWVTDASSALREALLQRYPPTHTVRLVRLDPYGQPAQRWDGPLSELHAELRSGGTTALYLAPLPASADRRGLDGLAWVVTRLLGPDGCPWDRKQTHQSLRAGLLEETHEVLEALDAQDMPALAEELGDLLLQVLVHSEMARQAGHFDLGNVLEQISTKLIRRHPHVFGDPAVEDTRAMHHTWEQIKAQELAAKGRQRASILDGIPADLPALAAAQKIVTKAARVGFDWSALHEVWDKVREEVEELAQVLADPQTLSPDERHHLAEELGDLLFTLVNLARWLNLDAESVLREANAKFRRRFTYVEQTALAENRDMRTMNVAELEELWQQAKRSV